MHSYSSSFLVGNPVTRRDSTRLAVFAARWRYVWVLIQYLLGRDAPAQAYLQRFRDTATRLPVPGTHGRLRGYSSLTVVSDFEPAAATRHAMTGLPMVVKFECRPGKIPLSRMADEQKNEQVARRYLDRFMPLTLRVMGHGIDNRPGALVYQQRITGSLICHTPVVKILGDRRLCQNLLAFCDGVLEMYAETGQLPDLAGSLPRVDWLTNLFWRSKHIMLDFESGNVWLVDTGAQSGQESIHGASRLIRWRTWVRLETLKLFRRLLR